MSQEDLPLCWQRKLTADIVKKTAGRDVETKEAMSDKGGRDDPSKMVVSKPAREKRRVQKKGKIMKKNRKGDCLSLAKGKFPTKF